MKYSNATADPKTQTHGNDQKRECEALLTSPCGHRVEGGAKMVQPEHLWRYDEHVFMDI